MTTNTPTGSCAETCRAIAAASTESEVVGAVRQYLGMLDLHKVTLPGTLLSLQVNHAADIASVAVDLARHEATLVQQGPEATLLKDVCTVLSTAAMRLVMISMEPTASTR